MAAKDWFEKYYTEKLWDLVPDIYRYEDGLGTPPAVLRSIIELLAEQAAIVRRSNDRVWEDQYIELCNEWAVPYIGALVGTRMLSDKNKRGRRVDVAKTIYYRRRKGTPKVLEELISDISGWDGIMIENFHRLGRAHHGLDALPVPFAGRLTGTFPEGWADLRDAGGSELADGPFEEYFHTADMRFAKGLDGRYGIMKLSFYLYRLKYYEIENVTPFRDGANLLFTFDPSGRDIHLFQPRNRPPDWDNWHPALEWELPAPIRCRLLGDAQYLITGAVIQQIAADPLPTPPLTAAQSADLQKLYGWPFRDEAQIKAVFISFPSLKTIAIDVTNNFFSLILKYAIVVCGKSQLLPSAISVTTTTFAGGIPVERMISANLSNTTAAYIASLAASSFNKVIAIDPERGRFMFLDPAADVTGLSATYYMGFSAPLGAGTYSRSVATLGTPNVPLSGGGAITIADLPLNGFLQINDNATYGPVVDPAAFQTLVIQSADQTRPYIQISKTNWTFQAGPGTTAELILDGLWIGNLAADPPVASQFNIVLSGDFAKVIIRNCTLDPGGSTNILGQAINPVSILVQGNIDQFCIINSITGPISILQGTGEVENLSVCDSIIQSITAGVPALEMDSGKTSICRTTIFGMLTVDHLEASEIIVTGLSTVSDTQDGCLRFSAVPFISRVPHPYECLLYNGSSASWFNSSRFGDSSYAQLSDVAPAKISQGGEDGCEMGAFSNLLNPFRLHDLQAKVQEYMPFGLIPLFINQT
jgi:hypothetical protein